MKASMSRYLRRVFLLLLVTARTASAAELEVSGLKVSDVRGTAAAYLRPAPIDGVELFVADAQGQGAVRAKATPLPADLWVLVDSSALCQAQKVDSYVNRLVHALKRQASPETTLTLVAYTSEAVDVLARRKPVAELGDVKIECESRPYSSSYDRPMARLLQELKPLATSPVAWVFTSGNLDLGRETAKALAARNVELHVVLYNEFVEKEIRPAWQSTQALLRGQRVSFGVLPKADAGVFFPSFGYRLEFPVSRAWAGASTLLQIGARVPGAPAPLARRDVTVDIPASRGALFWSRYGTLIVTGLLAALVLGTGYALFRYYRPRRCPECRRRLSFAVSQCLFCDGGKTAFLVGKFRRRADGFSDTGLAEGSPAVLPLFAGETELGTHRKSPLRFPRRRSRTRFARLVRESVDSERPAYRLVRESSAAVDIRVNGHSVATSRYLASGDELLIDTTLLTFFVEGKDHA